MVNFGRKDVGMITLLKVSLMGWNRRKLVLLSLGGQEETTQHKSDRRKTRCAVVL